MSPPVPGAALPRALAAALCALLAACAVASPRGAAAPEPACAGAVQAPPAGLAEVADPALLAQAIGGPGEGRICTGKAFEARASGVVVWRVWNSARPHTEQGAWWTFDRPAGPRASYQAAYAICPEWSALDRVVRCTLTQGARVVVGPGQSARCADRTWPASAVNQVFVPNDAAAGRLLVEGCQTVGAFE